MANVTSNIFQVKRIMNAQTVNQNRFSLRFIGLTNLINRINNWAEKRPELYWKYQGLVRSAIWTANGQDQGVQELGGSVTTNEFEDVLELSLLSANLPSVQAETQALARFNDSTRALTKIAEMEDMTVNFYDYVNGSSSTVMELWRSMVFDKLTGAMGLKKHYMCPYVLFYVYGPDAPGLTGYNGEFQKSNGWVDGWIQCYKMVNVYPKQVNLGEHSAENGEARKVEVTFSVDNVYQIGAKYYDSANKTYVDSNNVDTVGDTSSATNYYYQAERSKQMRQWATDGAT